jgi:hypothetical protein
MFSGSNLLLTLTEFFNDFKVEGSDNDHLNFDLQVLSPLIEIANL